MASASLNTQSAILDRALSVSMTPEAARYFLSLQLDPIDKQLAEELADRARAGNLTPEEQVEIDAFRRAGRTIEMLKLRARSSWVE